MRLDSARELWVGGFTFTLHVFTHDTDHVFWGILFLNISFRFISPPPTLYKQIKQGVRHTVTLPFEYLKANKELWKLKYFTMQKYNLKKNPLKETKILQHIITL
jgi:hypothetical protein